MHLYNSVHNFKDLGGGGGVNSPPPQMHPWLKLMSFTAFWLAVSMHHFPPVYHNDKHNNYYDIVLMILHVYTESDSYTAESESEEEPADPDDYSSAKW